MDESYAEARYLGAVSLLPERLRREAERLDRKDRILAEEIRLRRGRPAGILLPEGERLLPGGPVTDREMEALLEIATQASVHAVRDGLRDGYIAVRGGYRLGVCGSAVTERGEMTGLSVVSSAALRIARQVWGAAEPVLSRIVPLGEYSSTLILSPPGGGKTTLLRDIVRTLSDKYRLRVALADERCEIAAMQGGVPQMDVGIRTDVLEKCPKSHAAMLLLRGMNPQVLAMDEITRPEDVAAAEQAAYCGVRLAATAHADGPEDLKKRPLYRRLLEAGIFRRAVTVFPGAGGRRYRVTELEGDG